MFSFQSNVHTSNLKILIYAKLGRPKDALALLEELCSPSKYVQGSLVSSDFKHQFLSEVISAMVEAMEKSEDAELKKRASLLFTRLDHTAVIVDQTIENFALIPIGRPENVRKSNPRKKFGDRKDRNYGE